MGVCSGAKTPLERSQHTLDLWADEKNRVLRAIAQTPGGEIEKL